MNNINIRHGFAFKLSLYLITGIVIIFIIILSYDYYISKKSIIQKVKDYTYTLSDSVINKISIELDSVEKVSLELANILEHAELNEKEMNDLLKSTVDSNHEIDGCTIAFEPYMMNKDKYYFDPYYYKHEGTGKFFEIDNDAEYNYFARDWYTIPKKMNKGVWSEPYFDEGGGNVRMVTFSQPFYKVINGERKFCGIVACDITLDWLMEYVTNIKIFESGFAFIISPTGIFIQHKNKDYIMNENIFSIASKLNNPQLKAVGDKMLNRERGFEEFYSSYLKTNCYLTFAPLETSGWSIGVIVPEDELLAELNEVILKLFVMGLIGYFLTLIIIVFLSRKLTWPLRNLANATYKIGEGNFTGEIPRVNTSDEIGVLSRSFQSMQENLIKYVTNLQETTAAKEKIEKELGIAREIQQSIIPHNFPKLKQLDIYAMLSPAREIGGDLYDFFFIDDKHFCFAIGDVSGKGVPAALFMAITKTLLRAKVSTTMNPAQIVNAINSEICKENESMMFVTFFLAILNIETGYLEYCNAGHNPPLVHASNKEFYYFHEKAPQPPVGLIPDMVYHENSFVLFPEDIFFLYTDGITEAMNAYDAQFSEEKLQEILIQNKNDSIINIINKVKTAVDLHASGTVQSDDLTMMAIKYKGK